MLPERVLHSSPDLFGFGFSDAINKECREEWKDGRDKRRSHWKKQVPCAEHRCTAQGPPHQRRRCPVRFFYTRVESCRAGFRRDATRVGVQWQGRAVQSDVVCQVSVVCDTTVESQVYERLSLNRNKETHVGFTRRAVTSSPRIVFHRRFGGKHWGMSAVQAHDLRTRSWVCRSAKRAV